MPVCSQRLPRGLKVISVLGAIRRPPTSMSWSETFRTERKEWPLELMEASPPVLGPGVDAQQGHGTLGGFCTVGLHGRFMVGLLKS